MQARAKWPHFFFCHLDFETLQVSSTLQNNHISVLFFQPQMWHYQLSQEEVPMIAISLENDFGSNLFRMKHPISGDEYPVVVHYNIV